jgi:hypothetical protein
VQAFFSQIAEPRTQSDLCKLISRMIQQAVAHLGNHHLTLCQKEKKKKRTRHSTEDLKQIDGLTPFSKEGIQETFPERKFKQNCIDQDFRVALQIETKKSF